MVTYIVRSNDILSALVARGGTDLAKIADIQTPGFEEAEQNGSINWSCNTKRTSHLSSTCFKHLATYDLDLSTHFNHSPKYTNSIKPLRTTSGVCLEALNVDIVAENLRYSWTYLVKAHL